MRTKRSAKVKRPRASKSPEERPLRDGEYVQRMASPNNMVPLEPVSPDELAGSLSPQVVNQCWPLVSLQRKNENDETVGVFVADEYGSIPTYAYADHPPTWFDPHVFGEMCWRDPLVQEELRKLVAKNLPRSKSLTPLLSKVLDEVYLPWMFERFAVAEPLIADWLLRRAAETEIEN